MSNQTALEQACGCAETYPQLRPGSITHGPGCSLRFSKERVADDLLREIRASVASRGNDFIVGTVLRIIDELLERRACETSCRYCAADLPVEVEPDGRFHITGTGKHRCAAEKASTVQVCAICAEPWVLGHRCEPSPVKTAALTTDPARIDAEQFREGA
jgi:hypothetical protein